MKMLDTFSYLVNQHQLCAGCNQTVAFIEAILVVLTASATIHPVIASLDCCELKHLYKPIRTAREKSHSEPKNNLSGQR